jgi:hypothetical protein
MVEVIRDQEFRYSLLSEGSYFLTSQNTIALAYIETEQEFLYSLMPYKEFELTFDGGLIGFTYDIRESVEGPDIAFQVAVLEKTPVEITQRFIYNLLNDDGTIGGVVPSVLTEYEVMILLDGEDVTDKVSDCSVSYSRDSFTGDINVTFKDPEFYRRLDCTDLVANYRQERLELLTRIKGDSEWQSQGKFFIESRDTALSHDGGVQPKCTGRTKTAKLSAPYATPISKDWSDPDQGVYKAKAIAEEVLAPYPDIELVWLVMDYDVWPGRLAVDNVPPIDVINTLAAPLGAIVSTDKAGRLIVRYRWENI